MTESKLTTAVVEADEEEKGYDVEKIYMIDYNDDVVVEADEFAKESTFAKSLSGLDSNRKRKITRMEKHFHGTGGTGTQRIEDEVVTGYNAFECVSPPYNLSYLAKLYEISPSHKSAVDAKTANIVGLGYDFVESPTTKRKLDETEDADKTNKFRRKLARAHDDILTLIDSFNEEDTFSEVLAKVWKDYETTGNGYIEVSRKVNGQIGYIGHMPATTVRIRRSRDGFVQIISNKAVFFRNFGKDDPNPIKNDKRPNELIHLKKYSPTSTYYGVPDIIAAKQAVAGNEFAARFNLDYFENKAVPRHVIILKGATIAPRLAKNVAEFFETGLKGKNHRSLFIPLPGDTPERKVEFKIEAVEAKIQDASFKEYRKDNKNEILMAHRVPITKVSVGEGVALAVAKDADKTFKEQVCQPEQRILEKKLHKIVKELTDLFLLKLNEMSLTDANTQSQIDERRRKTGTQTANEQRAARGEPGHPDGDELVDLNAAAKVAEARNEMQAQGNRERDANRSAGATDSAGAARQPKGDGRNAK